MIRNPDRPDPGNPGGTEPAVETRAFLSYVRTGVERMQADEVQVV